MSGKHLTQEARFYIEKRLADNTSRSQIARELGVHPSTISQEIKRNTAPDFKQLYSCRRAETLSRTRRTTASTAKAFRGITEKVKRFISERLAVHASPDVISGELRIKQGIYISENTIYRYIKQDKLRGGTLFCEFPHRGKPYNRHQSVGDRVKITGRVGIELRPPVADLKQEPGHFEIDTIFGLNQTSFLLTAVDKANKIGVVARMAKGCNFPLPTVIQTALSCLRTE